MHNTYRHIARLLLPGILLLTAGAVIAGQPSARPFLDHPPAMVSGGHYLYGRVVETMDSGGYTYVQLDTGSSKVWAAGPVTPVKKGDPVRISSGMPMKNFHSKTLKRDFDLLYFSNEIKVASQKDEMTAMPPRQDKMAALPPHHDKAKTKVSADKLKRAKNGKTIAEIYRDRKKLAGKKVRVRGMLAKYVGNIYGKNWLHIRDNSSKQDLLVITSDKTRPGDVVLVEGTVALDKDNGIGQVYKVVLEDARLLGE